MMRTLVSTLSFFGSSAPPAPRGIPQRVQRLIEAAEDQSERLIGWVQLFVVGSLAFLYLLAPRPTDAPPGSLFDPVPAALLVYALFTVVRLWFAYRQRLPGILLLVSILADVALLVGLIWSFHAQYGQPPPFSLKVPTFVYFFVFIAIRALRFDPRYVLAAGFAAAAGWILLVVAVLQLSGEAAITRSFIVHVNASRVLIGAEFDKVMALLLVTGVLALAVHRGRRLFVTAIRDEAALQDLARFLGKGVSDVVTDAEAEAEPGMAVEREAAIIMLDIRGFTQLTSGLSPRSVVAILTGLHARIIPIVRANGGIIDKFMGDGIMATFGAVSASSTAAADALRALDAIMIEAADWHRDLEALGERADFRLQGSVVAGPVLFAIVGSGLRMEYTVIGEAVNLAAKLEKHNKLQGTRALTTRQTLETALGQGYSVPVAPTLLRDQAIAGVVKPVDIVVMAP